MAKIKCEVCGREEEQVRLAGNFEICFKCRADTRLYLLYSKWKECKKKENFFLRYKNKPKLLIEEHPELGEEVEKLAKTDMEEYNRWLFKKAFEGSVE